MKVNLLRQRVTMSSQLIALVVVIVIAVSVGYAAWQSSTLLSVSSQQSEVFGFPVPVSVDSLGFPEVPSAPTPSGELYFAVGTADDTLLSTTYAYSFLEQVWNPVLEMSEHNNLHLIPSGKAYASVSSFLEEVDVSSIGSDFNPALITLETGEISYLDVPAGYNEMMYRAAPDDETTVAFMQQTEINETDQISDWNVVVHQTESLETIVIAEAMYPQWLSADELIVMQSTGPVIHNLETGDVTPIVTPYSDYTADTEFVLSSTDDQNARLLVVTGREGTPLTMLTDDQSMLGKDISFRTVMLLESDDVTYANPVLSADGSEFAVIRRSFEPLTDEYDTVVEITHFETQQISDTIALSGYEQSQVSLLGWN